MKSPTHLNHYRWLCSQGRALRHTHTDGSCAWIHHGCVHAHAHTHTHAHSIHMHVPVCLFPPPVLPQSALKHAPLPRIPGQPEAKVQDRGWGGSSKGEQCSLPTLTGGVLPLSGTLMGAATRWICFLSHLVFLGLLCSSISRENSLARGGGFGTPSGGLAFGKLCLNYLERKTEVMEVAMWCGHGRGPPSPPWCTYSDCDQFCFNRLILWF